MFAGEEGSGAVACPLCRAVLPRPHLPAHLRLHSRPRPQTHANALQCPFCLKKYSTWNSLKKHKSVYHREQSWNARGFQRILERDKENT
ncbi:hypothetical protein Pmani_008389 [Petrolisthes manimaculis]|uniref:C2H2-type domain-containing protein n=1 Tax=Petrolisthes manimaculis TaxID=1843537 RepID=A0AAE1Q742_9EUCA|nr:hypothetical protein Pmani_008389 [Petrolisthes manimaculis]